jgi:hypothetical protein
MNIKYTSSQKYINGFGFSMLVLVSMYYHIYNTYMYILKGIRSKRVPPVFLEKNIDKKSGLIRLAAVRLVARQNHARSIIFSARIFFLQFLSRRS